MGTFLFDEIIFGPVRSRRLGISLGINLLPQNRKICNFNCLYCECGWTSSAGDTSSLPDRKTIRVKLEEKLSEMKSAGLKLDVITYAGNGEPTLHPEFSGIVDDTIEVRNKYYPEVKIAVLSNATAIGKESTTNALRKVDQNILKLDSAINETFSLLNDPSVKITPKDVIEYLKTFEGKFILQTMFIRANIKGKSLDNTTLKELNAWKNAIIETRPSMVMIYTYSRETPHQEIEKVSISELDAIADEVRKMGFEVQVSG